MRIVDEAAIPQLGIPGSSRVWKALTRARLKRITQARVRSPACTPAVAVVIAGCKRAVASLKRSLRLLQKGTPLNTLIFLFFFVSGACGLIYEVVWSRMMTLIFGRSVLAVGIVLAAFMSGLALGSYVLGRAADRSRNPLRLYAFYEFGIGITALIASLLLTRTGPVHFWLHETFAGWPILQMIGRFLMVFALLILPTTLMGATLPILSRVVMTRLSHVGHDLGRLYAINTIGAVAGSFAAGFSLIKLLGLHGTVNLAVAGNAAVGAFAWLVSGRPGQIRARSAPSPRSHAAPSSGDADPGQRRLHRLLLFSFALSGLASFSYEMFWTRSLVFLLGNTTYAFTLMLTAFLSGIALGGYGIRFLADIVKNPLRLFAVIEILIGIFSAIALPMLFFIVKSKAVYSFIVRFSGSLDLLAVSNFVIALSVMLLPAILIGATLPLLGRIFVSDLGRAGTTVGRLYAANTVGNVLGALLPGLLIMPVMGIQKGILVVAALNIGLGVVLLFSRWKHVLAVVSACVVLFFGATAALLRMPIGFQFPSQHERPRDEVLFYREGGLVTTKVFMSADTGYRVISVDGINIGGTGDSDYKQQILAHLPKLLLSSYSSELSIGLGSGILAGESGRHAQLRKIVCVEISRGVAEGARFFSRENHEIMNDPRAVIVVDDVADFLQTSSEQYDMISADEKTTGKYASNSFSYSSEYYALLRKHLAPGGLAIQWVPTDLPPAQYALVLRTFLDGFPHVQLWYFPPVGRFTMTNTFLIGSNEPIAVDAGRMQRILESDPESFKGIRKYGLTTADAVAAHYVGNEESLRALVPRGPENTFDRPSYEFYSPGDYAAPVNERTLVNHLLLTSARAADFDRRLGDRAVGDRNRIKQAFEAETILFKGLEIQLRAGSTADAMDRFDQAIARAPENKSLRNEVLSYLNSEFLKCHYKRDYAEGTVFLAKAARLYPESEEVHFDYGWVLAKTDQARRAVEELQRAMALNPEVVPGHRLLASLYAGLGQAQKAVEEWQKALALDENDVETLTKYGVFIAEHGHPLQALPLLRKAYERISEDPEVIDGYARVEYLSGDLPKAREIVVKGGDYYKGNPLNQQFHDLVLNGAQ